MIMALPKNKSSSYSGAPRQPAAQGVRDKAHGSLGGQGLPLHGQDPLQHTVDADVSRSHCPFPGKEHTGCSSPPLTLTQGWPLVVSLGCSLPELCALVTKRKA